MDRIRVLLADDHAILRDGIRALLTDHPDIVVIGEAEDGHWAVHLAHELHPDVVLMDIGMPRLNGLEATRQIKHDCPEAAVLILTMHDNEEYLRQVLAAGASGYVLKTVNGERLAENIRSVYRGEVLLSPSIAAKVVQQLSRLQEETGRREEALHALTPREREVFFLASRGLKNTEIAAHLYLSEKTIKTHLRNIYNKLNLTSKADLRLFAVKMGLVSDRDMLTSS